MKEVLGPFLEIRPTDVIDILVVTVLVYTAIAWIRRTQAAQVARGILTVGLVYVAARALQLQLTAWIFQGFFAIFVIILVVIFQEELRQLFEQVAVWRLRRPIRAARPFAPVDIVVQCLSDFARDRIGALVVIPGTQPIHRHVQGGIELGGRVSLPLLKSIFDVHSPGHDGAVLLEDGRVSRFAAHLPLSKDFRQLAGAGTRHSAALGLAELTDALCLVVSEERGQIAYARDGVLVRLANPQQVSQILERFFQERCPAPESARSAIVRALRENWLEKVVALVVVVGLWYLFIPGSRPTSGTYDVPVTIANLPDEYVLEEVEPKQVSVTLSGLAREFYLFDSRRLEVTIDASLAKVGRRTFRLTNNSLSHPPALSVEDLSPSRIKISLRKSSGTDQGDALTKER